MRKHHTLTRMPFSGAPFGDLGKPPAPITGTSLTIIPETANDPHFGAWFDDQVTITLMEGETVKGLMRKIDRATQKVDNNSGNGAKLTLKAGNDASLADVITSGNAVTIKALKAGRANYHFASGDGSVTATMNLVVTPKPPAKAAQITTQPPAAVTLKEGDPISIKVTATGATAYRWEKLKADGKTWEAVNGKTTDTLAAAVAVPADTGSYHVVISGEPGSADVVSTVCVLTVTAKPTDHLNLIESGTAPGTLTDYANGLQTLSMKAGTVFTITVQRIAAGSSTAISGGGNNFTITSAGDAAIAEAIHAPSDTTNKRTLQITGKAQGASTVKLASADGQALVTLVINIS